MTKHSVVHDTFTIERRYPQSPPRVFAAFADPKAKAQWFKGPPDWEAHKEEFDFRVGGWERSGGGPKGGVKHTFEALYQDIVPNERIVYSYVMHLDDRKISVSQTTIELRPDGTGTRLVFTEQGAYLDGYDDAGSRRQGSQGLLDQLGDALGR